MGYVLLIIGAIIGGGLCVGVEELVIIPWVIVPHTKAAQFAADKRACDAKVALIQSTLANDALAKVDSANSAIATLTDVPDDKTALQALCNAEAACRDRKR